MAFDKVDQAVPNFPKLEAKILDMWKERRVFERTLEETEGKEEFVFYEGPPTANGRPHNGHVLTRVIKDLFPRYMTMRGYHVKRRAGWDTHGLPVEVEVEKELRISGKQAILDYGVEEFSKKCMESVFKYTEEWEHLTERIGFWVNLDEAYVTFHKAYIESVWWALSELFKKGMLYKGHKVVWWWSQGGTALSAGEVGNSYKTVNDPSCYVRFPLKTEDASLVVWTTTPWTLPSNMFAAVHVDFDYAYVKDAETGETLILAEALVPSLAEKLGRSLETGKVVKGSELVGKHYTPPFDVYSKDTEASDDRYWRIVAGNKAHTGTPQWFVTLEAGTGIVHLAPAFGEDDWKVWRNERMHRDDIEMLCTVNPDGKFDASLAGLDLEGVWVKDGDKALMKDLKARSLLVHNETYRHEYPFCWRSDKDPLIQYARDAWFIKTTSKIDKVIDNNQNVEWFPEHIKDGRFGDFLGSNVDWALSRERFWGTPLNIWECDACDHKAAPNSCDAIEALNPNAFAHFDEAQAKDPELSEHLKVHKPWIDEVTFDCEKCSGTMHRVTEVIDCWFDSGCMPFAQLGYPHVEGSKAAFDRSFPADFISEAIDQTRGWFYSLMAVSNLIFDQREDVHPYKRCIVLGLVLDTAGKKESKSKGNYTPPDVILDAVQMQFAAATSEATFAKGLKAPKAGEALVAKEDLEGLDLKDGASVVVYRDDQPDTRLQVILRAGKKVPRRKIVLADESWQALSMQSAPEDTQVVEVPTLPAAQRVMVACEQIPAPGADAFRWFFYASNPPWNNTRHSLSNVRTLQKELPIKLRNVYSFFVTYANIDAFDPVKDGGSKRDPGERPLLDRWICSELEKTKRDVVAYMDEYKSYEATLSLTAFVDGLSNWYVRRSRERFWAEGRAQDKMDAYWTLYQCLRDFSVIIAPFLPFAADDMYQNLVVQQYGDGYPDSVHLRSFPSGDVSRIDEALSRDMAEVRALVSLGLNVRAKSKMKVRQPLKEAEIVLADSAREAALVPYIEIMKEELNVHDVKFVSDAEQYVTYVVKPNFQTLGKRLGKKMKATQKALMAEAADVLKRTLDADGHISIQVDGEAIDLDAADVLVQVEAKEGFAAASTTEGVVVLNCTLDEGLRKDGLYREILSRIQAVRKEMNLDFAARIKLGIEANDAVIAVCREREEALKRETLTTTLVLGASVEGQAFEVKIEGEAVTLHVGLVPLSRGQSQLA